MISFTKRDIYLFVVLILVGMVLFRSCSEASYVDLIQSVNTVPSERAENVAQAVERYSDKYGVGQGTIFAIMWTESHFRNIVGDENLHHKACGYMQIRSNTFEEVMSYPTNCNQLIYDWEKGIEAGIKYFGKLKAEFSYYSALSAYNAGFPVKSNSQYVKKVLQKRQKVKEFK